MTNATIELGQIEELEIPILKDFLNSNFAKLLGSNRSYTVDYISKNFLNVLKYNGYFFTLKAKEHGDFKKKIRGFGSLTNLDWVARHCELKLISVSSLKDVVTIEDDEEALGFFKLLVRFAFDSLNLNKVWIEVVSGHQILKTLNNIGFVSEGIRNYSKDINGVQVNSTVCSLLFDDYEDLECWQ